MPVVVNVEYYRVVHKFCNKRTVKLSVMKANFLLFKPTIRVIHKATFRHIHLVGKIIQSLAVFKYIGSFQKIYIFLHQPVVKSTTI